MKFDQPVNTISQFIPGQFPRIYQENDPMLLAFVRAYYEWMESPGNPLYYSQKIYGIKDIDQTLDQFIVFFKQKYLRDIQLDTSANIKTIIKHALDIYRSKGSPQEIELLFQLIYQTPIDIYYPSTDLFRLSDGVWYVPTYLEITLSSANINSGLEQKEITGITSGAVAFVDRIIRTTVKGRLVDIAYISAITKDFVVNEKIIPVDGSIDVTQCPTIIGSLSDIAITSTSGIGQNYNIGDLVNVTSATGEGAIIRVANTTASFGFLDIKFIDGGYGFANTATVYVSNAIFTIANATFANSAYYLSFLDPVTQPIGLLAYTTIAPALSHFHTGDNVFTYHGDNSPMGNGHILAVNETSTTNGVLTLAVTGGSLQNNIFTTANAVHATLATYTDVSATGKYIGMDSTISLFLTTGNSFVVGETIGNGLGSTGIVASFVLASKLLIVGGIRGSIQPGQTITGLTSGVTDTVASMNLTIGVSNVGSNGFVSIATNYITDNNLTGGSVIRVFNGSGTMLSLANTGNLIDTESIALNTDIISGFLGTLINATAYNFPGHPAANLTNSTIGATLSYNSMTIGKIKNILIANTGSDFDHVPIIVVNQPEIVPYFRQDYVLGVMASGGFAVGEIVYQGNNNPAANVALGIVKPGSNTSILYLQNLKFSNSFINTTNTATQIQGNTSGTTANVTSVSYDTTSALMGRNAVFTQSFVGGNGSITSATIVDSGLGFLPGQTVTLANGGQAAAVLQHQGRHQGYYKEKGGFLSDQKKLYDGDYYQNYSYEIISPIVLDKYQSMLKQLGHPAGTKLFGRFKHIAMTGESKNIITGSITLI